MNLLNVTFLVGLKIWLSDSHSEKLLMEVFLTCPCTELLYINSTDLQLQIKLQLRHLAKTHPDTLLLHPKSLTLCNARYPGQMTVRLLLGKSILLKICKFPSSHCPRSTSPTPLSNPLRERICPKATQSQCPPAFL